MFNCSWHLITRKAVWSYIKFEWHVLSIIVYKVKTEKEDIQNLNHQTSAALKSITIKIAEVLHLNWAQVTM